MAGARGGEGRVRDGSGGRRRAAGGGRRRRRWRSVCPSSGNGRQIPSDGSGNGTAAGRPSGDVRVGQTRSQARPRRISGPGTCRQLLTPAVTPAVTPASSPQAGAGGWPPACTGGHDAVIVLSAKHLLASGPCASCTCPGPALQWDRLPS